MADFNTTVLREKFIIRDRAGDGDPVVALSNRVALTLVDSGGDVVEHIVVRTQTLHTTVRFAAQIYQTFHRTGPLLNRQVPVNWNTLWEAASGDHERKYNSHLWGALYANGKPVFQHNEHHSFLDVIEQCETQHKRNYEHSLLVAEEMFMKAGHPVSINYDSNIAMVLNTTKNSGKCGAILRGAQRTSTFNFRGENPKEKGLNGGVPVHFMTAAAAFLEAIQLCFSIGRKKEDLRINKKSPYSEDGQLLSSAQRRLGEMNAALGSFETAYNVHYRPEKPDFNDLISQAEALTRAHPETLDVDEENLADPPR